MIAVASALATLLADAGLVDYRPDTAGGDTYLFTMPDQAADPDLLTVGIFLEPGQPDPVRRDHRRPQVQVRVRGGHSAVAAWERAEAIRAHLHALPRTPLGDDVVLLAADAVNSAPVGLGVDARGRHEFTATLTLTLTGATP